MKWILAATANTHELAGCTSDKRSTNQKAPRNPALSKFQANHAGVCHIAAGE